ncbi:MAG: hypothetical protein JJU45_19990 [Acidimicrobiia bacterium]|nr:hypothetical protein [Acidimicrobiia bacterium]MCC5954376.1 hypothetical protein [Acidimicrobiia bacterium]
MNEIDRSLGVGDPELIDRSPLAIAGRRVTGRFLVDEWGLDSDLVAVVGRLPSVRWGAKVHGAGRIPDGPALLVHDRHPADLGWLVVVAAIGRATGRSVRFTGVPDVAPLMALARRVGGVGSDPADLRGLLRAGNLVTIGLGWGHVVRTPGGPPAPWAIEAALATGAPLVPVAVHRGGLRALRPEVRIGEPVATRRRRSARAADDVSSEVCARVAALL